MRPPRVPATVAVELSWRAAALVAAGGAAGSLARFALASWVERGVVPWGVVVVNVAGSFLAGLLLFGALERGLLGPYGQELVLVGLLGGFTTMSTFAVDSAALLAQGSWGRLVANVVLNPVASVAAALAGRALALAGR